LLGEACTERIAIGKHADELELPFHLVDDGSDVRAPLAGLVAGLRVAANDVVVVIPVDLPLLQASSLTELASHCRNAAVPPSGPLPGAYRRSTLPVLEQALTAGRLRLRDALALLDVAVVELDPLELTNVNTPTDLDALRSSV
jgi:molybdopterin-guanine dinucleotide biosynthesis protein A